jgi:formate hydrogenlyase subunit 5
VNRRATRRVPRLDPGSVLRGRFQSVREPGAPPGEQRVLLSLGALDRAVAQVIEHGGRFLDIFASEVPERCIRAAFALQGELIVLRARSGPGARTYPSLTPSLPAADWPERELRGETPVTPLAHPDPRPILDPDADAFEPALHDPETFTIPYGPIRSGVFEAIQFIIDTGGEDVLSLQTRPFFKRRNREAQFAGRSFDHGAHLAERVAGIASVAHAIAFSQAVERALELAPPARARMWRSVYAEIERIANHLDVAARLAEDCALAVGQARFMILKENVLRLEARMSGSRFSRGVVVPGGIRTEPAIGLDELAEFVSEFEADLRRDRGLLLRTTSFTDRLIGSGRLDRDTVEAFAGVGPVARAAGLSVDARFERPYAGYGRLGYEVSTRSDGDAMARLEVRFAEIDQSLHLIRQAIDRLRRDDTEARLEVSSESGRAFGWAEAPQGEVLYWVAVEDGRLREVRISSPSSRNWPLFSESFRGDVLTDFAFIEHSFGLTPAGADR